MARSARWHVLRGAIGLRRAVHARNIKEDLEDIGSRFDGAPDAGVPLGDQGARAEDIRPELPARPARLSLSVRPHAQGARGGVRGLAWERRMKVDDEIVELKEWDAVRVPPGTWRGYEAGPEGLEILVVGAPNLGEAPRAETMPATGGLTRRAVPKS